MEATLLELPNEITKKLSFRSSLRFKCVSNHLYTNIKLKTIKSNSSTPLDSHPYLEKVTFSSFQKDPKTFMDLLFLKKLRVLYGNLSIINLTLFEELIIDNYNPTFKFDVCTFPKLKTLSCHGFPLGMEKIKLENLTLHNVISSMLETSKKATLSIDNKISLGYYPTIKELVLENCNFGSQSTKVFNHFPNLVQLGISNKFINFDLTDLKILHLSLSHDHGYPKFDTLTRLESLFVENVNCSLKEFINLKRLSLIDNGDISYMNNLKTFDNFHLENYPEYILPQSIKKLVIYNYDPLLYSYKHLIKLEIYVNFDLTILEHFHLKSFKWYPKEILRISHLKHFSLEKLFITNIQIDKIECVNIKKISLDSKSSINNINTLHLEKLTIFSTTSQN